MCTKREERGRKKEKQREVREREKGDDGEGGREKGVYLSVYENFCWSSV